MKSPGSRVAGIAQIHWRLAVHEEQVARAHDLRNFKNLIRTLPARCYDETHKEDIDTNAEDHCFDALRYRLTRGTGKLVRMT